MKSITKTAPPEDYINWCEGQRILGVNYNFDSLQNPQKRDFHNFLLVEQGFLCPYTMKRIARLTSHLEHIKPQDDCDETPPREDLEYNNLIACYPREGMSSTARYGAQCKDNWWIDDGVRFVSPLGPNCELKFIFSLDGTVEATSSQEQIDDCAILTIGVLNLNDGELIDNRRDVINEFIYGETYDQPLSIDIVNDSIETIMDMNPEGQYYEFCLAIHDCLHEYLDIIFNLEVE